MKSILCLLSLILPVTAAPVLKNPQFTEGTSIPDQWTQTWAASGKVEVVRDTTTYHSAPASLRLQAAGGPVKGQVMQSFSAKAGESFTLRGRVRAEGGSNAILGVMAYDEKWQGLGFTAVGNALIGAGWVEVSGNVELPAATSHAGVVLMIDGAGQAWLDDLSTAGPGPAKPSPPRKPISSTDPAEGFYPDYPTAWKQTFEAQLERSKKGHIPILFLGDSLTQAWPEQAAWKPFAERGAVSFGMGGDGTSQILYRLDHGLIDGLHPKTLVLQIGVNNVWPGFSAEDTVQGIEAILDRLKQKAPDAKILLCGNTYFFDKGDGKTRVRVRTINEALAKIAKERGHTFIDFSGKFIDGDDQLKPDFYTKDQLHLTPAAYEVWAAAISSEL